MKYIDFENVSRVMPIEHGWLVTSQRDNGNNIVKLSFINHFGEINEIGNGILTYDEQKRYMFIRSNNMIEDEYGEPVFDIFFITKSGKLSEQLPKDVAIFSKNNNVYSGRIILSSVEPEICTMLEIREQCIGVISCNKETKESRCLEVPNHGFKMNKNKQFCRFHTNGQTLVIYQEKTGKKIILLDNPLC